MGSIHQSSTKSSKYQSNGKIHGSSSNSFDEHQVVAVMVPFPAQGHLNQLRHLSQMLLSHNIPVHYVGTTTHNRQAKLRVQGWDANSISNIHFHDFKVPPYAYPPPNPKAENKFPFHLMPYFK